MQFATNGSEKARIDSSGNLLVGTTSANANGITLNSGDYIYASRDGGQALFVNRDTSDGTLIDLRKGGTAVGQILTGAGGYMHIIGGNNTFGSGIAFNNQTWNPTNASGTITDNHVKLGDSGSRFTDLYLSGGVVETTTTVTYASSIALTYDNGSIQTVTLTGNVTFTDSLADGEAVVLMLNAGASHTVTWTAVNKWVTSGGNVAPTLTANDTLVFWKIGSTVYGAYAGSYT
jgi:hypothetical protein